MYNPHLGKEKVVVTRSDSLKESYIQNGDAASRRPVRFFTHNSGTRPELRFKWKISTVTTTAVLYGSERWYRGSSHTKHGAGLAVKLSFLWVGEEGRASPDSGGLLALQTSPLRLMYLWVQTLSLLVPIQSQPASDYLTRVYCFFSETAD